MLVCAGGENGFLKRPGMVDEYDQQVSTHLDGELCTLGFLLAILHLCLQSCISACNLAHQEYCLQSSWCSIMTQKGRHSNLLNCKLLLAACAWSIS